MIDEEAQSRAVHNLGEQHLDLGLTRGEPLFDLVLECGHGLLRRKNSQKKRASAHFRYYHREVPAPLLEAVATRLAPISWRLEAVVGAGRDRPRRSDFVPCASRLSG